jgi:hypothetical protein
MPGKTNSAAEFADKRAELSASAGKAPYERPTLSVFGSVRELTGSGTGGSSDGGMPML